MRVFRITMLMVLFLVIFGGLTGILVYRQIIRGPEIAEKAAAMRSKQIELKEYSRGTIWDRNLLGLTGVNTTTALYYFPQQDLSGEKGEVSDYSIRQLVDKLALIITDLDKQKTFQKIASGLKNGESFLRLESSLSDEEILELRRQEIPGLVMAPVQLRYDRSGYLAHVIGTVEEGENARGVSGIERIYDDILTSNPDSDRLVSVLDARGQTINGLMYKIRREQDQARGSVVLTIDKRVQNIVEQTMDRQVKKGAVVVMDIDSREILAMASRPDFDPYQVEKAISHGEESPLINRALTSYHPGSLYKLVVASAALEMNAVSIDTRFECPGHFRFSDQVSISCWKEEGHGDINFAEALAYSCNPAFIETALRVGRSDLIKFSEQLHVTDEILIGYGKYNAGSGINIEAGQPALGNAALGQQGVKMTPLQLASLLATIADGGRWRPPSLVLYSVDQQGRQHHSSRPAKERVLSSATAQQMQSLLELVISKGTGRSAALNEVGLAGKTGTSQTGQIDKEKQEILDAWFGGYLPAESPRWAVVVLVEEGVSGAQDAGPVFKEIARQLIKIYPTGISANIAGD